MALTKTFKWMEQVFKISGEGGGISISRHKDESGEKFVYEHNEFDPLEEGLDVHKVVDYNSFEEAFQPITKYFWFMMHIRTVHEDYKNYIIAQLIEALNKKPISPDKLNFNRRQLEKVLKIELKCRLNEKNELNWSFTQTKKS